MRLGLKGKLITTGLALTSLPILIIALLIFRQNIVTSSTAAQGCNQLVTNDLDHMVRSLYAMCQAYQDAIHAPSQAAKVTLQQRGPARLVPGETVEWRITNSLTNDTSTVTLPKLCVGTQWPGQITDPGTPVPFVDQIHELVGGTVTLFQRLNESGDMLCIATNALREGKRAIGTYIPARNADGQPNPMVTAVLAGEPYFGRAYAGDAWYITGYTPVFDTSKNVIGMLYVGSPEADATASIRQAMRDLKVGETGYVFVLNTAGADRGRYVVSRGGRRDGQIAAAGNPSLAELAIEPMVRRALALQPGEVGEHRYVWQKDPSAPPALKVVRLMYFKPWDWLIGVGIDESEFLHTAVAIRQTAARGMLQQLIVAAAAVIIAAVAWFAIARRLSGRLAHVTQQLREGSQQVEGASSQITSASQALAQGASTQAANLEETASALEEMSTMTRKNADTAREAAALSEEAQQAAQTGNAAMHRMSEVIATIEKSAGETAKIIKVINEIAFQTNLLALNAAVEAARAGKAGEAFAVVAGEVRALAIRSAEAAKNTAEMIETSIENARNSTAVATEVGQSLGRINTAATKVNQLVAEMASATREQAEGIAQINRSVAEIDKVTQANAASAEQSASASNELSQQAGNLHASVKSLVAVIGAS